MPDTDQLFFETQRRVILFNSGTTMPDGSTLGYEGNPNSANTSTPGQTLLYTSPRGTSYIELVNGNLWYKQRIPNTWINLTSGSGSFSPSQNDVVFITGNQIISGNKTFASRPTVNGTGVLLIGEASSTVLPNTIVYTTGNQTINGTKTFDVAPILSGNPLITGINLSSYITTGETGSFYPRSNPSGFIRSVDLSSYALANQVVYKTGDQTIGGNKIFSANTFFTNDINVGQNLRVTGTSTFNNNVNITGNLTIGGNVTNPTLVLTRGDQLISGSKTFAANTIFEKDATITGNLRVSGTSTFNNNLNVTNNLTVGGNITNPTLVLTRTNQTISGTKTFDVAPILGGNPLITGVDLSSYITTGQTGNFYPRNNPSGYITGVDLSSYVTTGQTGVFYPRNNPSGFITGVDLSSYITTGQTGNFYPRNNPSGYITGVDLTSYALADQVVYKTGNNVVYTTGDQNISGIKNFISRPTVNGTGVLLIGEASNVTLPATIVYTTGNQIISGVKTFANNLQVQGTGIFNALDLSNISQFDFSGTNINLINGNVNISGGTLYISGNPVLTGVNLTSYITTGQTGLFYPRNNPSGFITGVDLSSYATISNLELTGLNLSNNINSLSGVSVLTFGDQNIFGNKTFVNNINVSGTGVFNSLDLNNIDVLSLSGVDISISNGNVSLTNRPTVNGTGVLLSGEAANVTLPATIVYTTGNQTISGVKTFDQGISVAGGNVNLIGKHSIGIGYQTGSSIILQGGSGVSNADAPTSQAIGGSITLIGGPAVGGGFAGNNPGNITLIGGSGFGGGFVPDGSDGTARINLYAGPTYYDRQGGIIVLKGNTYINPDFNRSREFVIFKSGADALGFAPSNLRVSQNSVNVNNLLTVSGNPVLTGLSTLYATSASLDNKINSLSGSSVLIFGNQNIDGTKSFISNTFFGKDITVSGNLRASGAAFFNDNLNVVKNLNVSGDLNVGGSFNNPSLVLTRGDQLISGSKTFASNAFFEKDVNITGNLRVSGLSTFNSLNVSGNLTVAGSINNPNLVLTKGDQLISGNKTFAANTIFEKDTVINESLRVSGTSTFNSSLNVSGNLDVRGSVSNPTLVLTRGNQTISGQKTFLDKILLNTSATAPYSSSNDDYNLNIAGKLGENAGIQLDSYGVGGTSQILVRSARGTATNLSGLLKDDVIFNLAAKGYVSGLNDYSQNKAAIRYVTAEDWVSEANYTGQGTYISIRTTDIGGQSAIDKLVISTSGLNVLNGNIFISGNPVLTGVSSTPQTITNVVYTTGDQIISGNKTFLNNIAVSGTGNFNNVQVSNIDKLFLSGIDILITGNSSVNIYNDIYISGNKVLTGVIPQAITNVVYTTGNQLISGNKTFLNNVNISGTGNFNNVKVSSIDKLFLSGIDMVVTGNSSINVYNDIYISGNKVLTGVIPSSQAITDVVYTTGNQFISGIKTFLNNLQVSGTGIFQDINIINLNELVISGAKIIIGGDSGVYSSSNIYISGNQVLTGINLSSYATNINLFTTGSTLDNKINSLSGYLNSQDVIFSGQTAYTGSILDNKINSLSGYISEISAGGLLPNTIVYTTGDQLISGNKTFNDDVTFLPGASNGNQIIQLGLNNAADRGVRIFIPSGSLSSPTAFARAGVIQGVPHGYGIVFAGGGLTNKKGYLTSSFGASADSIIPTGYEFATLDWTNRILSGAWKTNRNIQVGDAYPVLTTGDQDISGNKTFANTGSFDTLQITNKKLSSYNYINSNFTFGDAHINIVNSSNNVIGALPSSVTSGINYYVKNLNTGVLLITGSNQITIDGFSNINLYKNESLQLLGVNNIGYTGWISLSVSVGVS